MSPNLYALAAEIKSEARALGFELAGVCPATPSAYRDYLRKWLDDGKGGEMAWLGARFEERTDPAVYLPGARSVICVAMNYYAPVAEAQGDGRLGRIARYAQGDDYHELMKSRLHRLADWLRSRCPEAQTRAAVDTAPVMEKELAARAGLGWIGRNTCLINPQAGSWLFLGEVLTTLELPADEPGIDRCGTCRRCIDACPTGAITAPYELDARRCISYLTIEHRSAIDAELAGKMGAWLYGCDICQEVCPWNSKAIFTEEPAMQSRFPGGGLEVDEVLGWDEQTHRQRLRGSAMKRVKLAVLKRNAGRRVNDE